MRACTNEDMDYGKTVRAALREARRRALLGAICGGKRERLAYILERQWGNVHCSLLIHGRAEIDEEFLARQLIHWMVRLEKISEARRGR